ncbi:MAG TPA: DUF2203 domain-containing protein [Tepidisphaeraceae bacterium]|nr:DUF2203 domain-containing protein [Tepidisphaeraceae bacterium]
MAGPTKSIVKAKDHKSHPAQRFTVALANKALPLVRRIVADVVKVNAQTVALQDKLEQTSEGRESAAVQAELDGRVARLNELVEELADVGCELKDYRTGLIDFVGRHKGRDVYLCWKLGEEKVGFWHEMNGGYAGRQPVSSLVETE